MDTLKLIPSVFFDGIARVVPGVTAIVAFLLLSGRSWSQVLETTLGPSFGTTNAQLTATALLFFTAYVVGQLIAPFAKLAQRLGEWKGLPERMRAKPKAHPDAYDFLRLYHKDAGEQCAKIRAEFTMFNGLAVVFVVTSVAYPMLFPTWRPSVLILLILTAVATAIRGRTTRDTFNGTVTKFVNKTTFPSPPGATLAPASGGSAPSR
jgi:hypothetical protein